MNKIITGLIGIVFSLSAGEIYATFNIQAMKSASLAFDASGVVKNVDVDISATVKKGDILASLENADKKANLDMAQTTLKYAKKDYDRQVEVKSLIDEAKFDAYAYKYENAKSQFIFQKAMYKKTYLRAPFDGVVFFKEVEVGDTVSGMMLKTVFKIQSINTRKLVIQFDQKYYKNVKLGDKFIYKIDGDKKEYTGAISKIYPTANPATRKISAEVQAENFMPGLFGHGIIKAK